MGNVNQFQSYLLSQMRAHLEVTKALQSLGIAAEDLNTLRPKIEAEFPPGHMMTSYSKLLGDPAAEEVLEEPGFRARLSRFALPLWPQFDFGVYHSVEGVVGDLLIIRRGAVTTNAVRAEWAPWSVTEAEVLSARPDLTVCDDWPPMRDYRSGSPGARLVFRFDFGLLQEVNGG